MEPEKKDVNESVQEVTNMNFVLPGDVLIATIQALGPLPFNKVGDLMEVLRTLDPLEESQIIVK